MNDSIEFSLADWTDSSDCTAMVSMLQAYALHPMGGGEPLSDYAAANLPAAMAATPGAFSVIAWVRAGDGSRQTAGLANCFTTLSTFACKPLVNIHDLYIHDVARGRGAGQALLAFVEKQAMTRGCCKLTLEVLTGNAAAITAYKNFGFKQYTMNERTGHALFMDKTLECHTPD